MSTNCPSVPNQDVPNQQACMLTSRIYDENLRVILAMTASTVSNVHELAKKKPRTVQCDNADNEAD